MNKRVLICVLMLFATLSLLAQHLEFQSDRKNNDSISTLFERISKIEKKTDRFNLNLDIQGNFNLYLNDDISEKVAFKMKQLRIEAKGNLTDKIYYRYRQRLNRSNNPMALDNLPASIDYAAVGFRITDKLSIFAGKQSTCFGGFEFDLNPVEVYEYSDMIEYMNNFLTGIDVAYWLDKNHTIHFQVVNSRNGTFSQLYGGITPDITPTKVPLGYTLNWNGSFFENILKTRWSASIFQEAKNKNWYYYALGTEVDTGQFRYFLDFMYSNEDIDRTGIISSKILHNSTRALNTNYFSIVLYLNYRICPKWNIFVQGMYETASVNKTNDIMEKGKYRTSWGYIGGVEFFPMKENLRFFLNYIGRSYNYTHLAKAFGATNHNSQRIELGLIYVLPAF